MFSPVTHEPVYSAADVTPLSTHVYKPFLIDNLTSLIPSAYVNGNRFLLEPIQCLNTPVP